MDDGYSSFKELIFGHYAGFGEKTAFQVLGKKAAVYTFSDLAAHVKAVGDVLEQLTPHHCNIGLVSFNSYFGIIAALAVICTGNCVIPIDAELSDEAILNQVEFADCSMVICSDEFEGLFRGVMPTLRLEALRELIYHGKMPDICGMEVREKPVLHKGAAMIVFTSGTTAVPKGVMLSEKNIIAVVKGSNRYLKPVGSVFCFLPLYHTYSFVCGILGTLATGEQIILNDSMRNFTKNLKNAEPHMIFAVPLILDRVKRSITENAERSGQRRKLERMRKVSRILLRLGIDIRKKVFSQIREQLGGVLDTVICGGAPLSGDTVAFFRDIGITVLNGYGITECAPLVAVMTNKAHSRAKDGSAGKPVYTCEVRIDAANDGDDGEILVHGENVMLGYYKNPEATENVLRNGWLYTGDVGHMDRYGNLYIRSRKKNMILLGNGKNVYPEELEEILGRVSGVSESVVFLGENEKITAEIYCEDGAAVHSNVKMQIEKANQEIPLYAQIREIVFRNKPFDKTTSQKIKRR